MLHRFTASAYAQTRKQASMKTPKHTPFSKGRHRGRRLLVLPIVAGILLGATSLTPAAAQDHSGDSLVASLENERFSVSTSNGEELRVKEASTSPAKASSSVTARSRARPISAL